jgi:hypothetical protein
MSASDQEFNDIILLFVRTKCMYEAKHIIMSVLRKLILR